MKTFSSLSRSNGVSKNPSFHTGFKNVHMTLEKSAPKKCFAQKTDFFRSSFSIAKIVFWLYNRVKETSNTHYKI